MKATWNGTVIAESDHTVVLEGNHYFPPESIRWQYFERSNHHTVCPWKGGASYCHVVVDGKRNPNAAWYYRDPMEAARQIRGYVAFWNGVLVLA